MLRASTATGTELQQRTDENISGNHTKKRVHKMAKAKKSRQENQRIGAKHALASARLRRKYFEEQLNRI